MSGAVAAVLYHVRRGEDRSLNAPARERHRRMAATLIACGGICEERYG